MRIRADRGYGRVYFAEQREPVPATDTSGAYNQVAVYAELLDKSSGDSLELSVFAVANPCARRAINSNRRSGVSRRTATQESLQAV